MLIMPGGLTIIENDIFGMKEEEERKEAAMMGDLSISSLNNVHFLKEDNISRIEKENKEEEVKTLKKV